MALLADCEPGILMSQLNAYSGKLRPGQLTRSVIDEFLYLGWRSSPVRDACPDLKVTLYSGKFPERSAGGIKILPEFSLRTTSNNFEQARISSNNPEQARTTPNNPEQEHSDQKKAATRNQSSSGFLNHLNRFTSHFRDLNSFRAFALHDLQVVSTPLYAL